MKVIECYLTIGFPGAQHRDELEFEDDTSDAEIEVEVREWADNYIEWGWSEKESRK